MIEAMTAGESWTITLLLEVAEVGVVDVDEVGAGGLMIGIAGTVGPVTAVSALVTTMTSGVRAVPAEGMMTVSTDEVEDMDLPLVQLVRLHLLVPLHTLLPQLHKVILNLLPQQQLR